MVYRTQSGFSMGYGVTRTSAAALPAWMSWKVTYPQFSLCLC